MERKWFTMVVVTASIVAMIGAVSPLQANTLSIYEVQYTDDANGISPENGNLVDCLGGIVTHKQSGGRPRLVLQDPNYPTGWGAIQVKGWSSDAFDNVEVGDRVRLTNVLVEDFKGTTFLQYQSENDPNLTVVSTSNPLPRPIVVGVEEIAAPIEGLDAWAVPDHGAEKYEAMLIKVINVSVTALGQGKAYDNYVLASNTDPNQTCWVSDYMNTDKEKGLIYHPYIETGRRFCGVSGILEQYTGDSDGIYYDYYQLLTRSSEDFIADQVADLDGDCDVDFLDFSILAGHWLEAGCGEPDWCGGADLVQDQSEQGVNMFDLLRFTQHWLDGK
ncbi:MAG: hypothetical protein P8Z79_14160 [Sedimentisphaerales bacterium]